MRVVGYNHKIDATCQDAVAEMLGTPKDYITFRVVMDEVETISSWSPSTHMDINIAPWHPDGRQMLQEQVSFSAQRKLCAAAGFVRISVS